MVSTFPLWMVHRPQSWTLLSSSNLDTYHQLSLHWKNCLFVTPQTHHTNFHRHWNNCRNHQGFNCSIEINQQNPLFPPSDIITHKTLFQINSTFSNDSSALKLQQSTILKLPSLPTPKPVAAPTRVSPSTTQHFHNISLTTTKKRRDLQPTKAKPNPKLSPPTSL